MHAPMYGGQMKNGEYNVHLFRYVGNLDPRISEDYINEWFSQAGKITKLKVSIDMNNLAHAFIEFRRLAILLFTSVGLHEKAIPISNRINWSYLFCKLLVG
ncbi:hypothetical protein M3Y97_00472500 [Aphelenchoides bicaudatus]|nr:hypothetical protein M3Y97_00472500 [Aphelenchoides bicaudatus]